jgi:hypothetical protein
VRELRTLKRARPGSRVRSVQGRLSIELGDEDEAGDKKITIESPARSSGFRRPSNVSGSKSVASDRSVSLKTSVPVFHPLAYRSVVADWPIECREQWGRRSNDLEETGLSWRDAETQAFVEIWHQLRSIRRTDLLSAVSATTATAD